MDYSSFFEVVDTMKTAVAPKHRLYYDQDGAIIDITYDELTGDYIIITQDEFDGPNMKRLDYTVVEGKLEFTIPKQRTWNLHNRNLKGTLYMEQVTDVKKA